MANEEREICGSELTERIVDDIGVGQWLFRTFSEEPTDTLVLTDGDTGKTVNRREILQLCTAFGSNLKKLGLQPNDVIAVVGDNSIDLCVVAFGATMMGGVICPIDPCLKSYEYQHIFKIIEPKMIVGDGSVIPTLRDAMAASSSEAILVSADDQSSDDVKYLKDLFINDDEEEFTPYVCKNPREETLCLVCSSGTTGLPKAVMLTHYGFAYQMASSGGKAWKVGPTLQSSFFYWISGILMMWGFACNGGHRILLRSTEPLEVIQGIEKYKAVLCVFSPTLLSSIVLHPQLKDHDVSSLKVINSGGSLLLKSTADKVKEHMPGTMIIQVYGLTEMSGAVCRAMPPMDILKLGKPSPGTKIKIVDVVSGEALGPEEEGELIILCPGVMKGYYNDPKATAAAIDADGWFHTGDLGKYSEDGILRITGRVKDLLKVDNHQVCPAEIENLIGTVPGVTEVVVVGITEGENQLPMALVVKNPDSQVSEEEIVKAVNENLSEFKQLRAGVVFVDEIKRTSNGKLKRREIQPIAEQLYMNFPL